MKLLHVYTLTLFLALTTLLNAQNSAEHFAPNRLIVKLKTPFESILQERIDRNNSIITSIGIAEIDNINAQLGCKQINLIKGGGIVRSMVLEFKNPINIPNAIQEYKNTGKFEYVEPDYIGHGGGVEACPPDLTPNDTYFSRQWGLYNNGTFSLSPAVSGKDINAVNGWNITTGSSSVVVCIIDSGCKLDHPDFAGRIWQNTREIAGNNKDDDGNGKIDDTQGWDFANSDNDPTDDHGHGTNVTSIIGATSNNSSGYAGVDWKCKLMIMKGLKSDNTGFYSWWETSIYYAVDNGAKVINMSLVGTFNSGSLEAAVNYAWQKGVIVVACMGNNNLEQPFYPAGFDNLIAVGSINANGKRSAPFFWSTTSGSNYGDHIDVCAPGNYIYGLSHSSNTAFNNYWGGTSQATPHATGLAALMLARNYTLTPTQIKDYMQKGAVDQIGDPAEDISGFDPFYGWGLINVKKTLDLIPAVSPTNDLNDESALLEVYPNPSKGVFTISAPSILRGGGQLQVLNLTGQVVYQKSISNNVSDITLDIDLRNQTKGIYIIHIKNEAVFMTKKVVLE